MINYFHFPTKTSPTVAVRTQSDGAAGCDRIRHAGRGEERRESGY